MKCQALFSLKKNTKKKKKTAAALISACKVQFQNQEDGLLLCGCVHIQLL